MQSDRQDLINAVDAAIGGRWDDAHAACQQLEGDKTADWLHAVLHKIEGDEANSRYWYRRSGQSYEAWADTAEELKSIKAVLTY
ncbi:MAG TPA: hypothetical protein VMX97_07460 [Hyphomicrobiaceae bacterium]|nr:hypothetical protein [Hyphomicrobiaceae bacterium]